MAYSVPTYSFIRNLGTYDLGEEAFCFAVNAYNIIVARILFHQTISEELQEAASWTDVRFQAFTKIAIPSCPCPLLQCFVCGWRLCFNRYFNPFDLYQLPGEI